MTIMPLADKVHKFIEKESLFNKSSQLLIGVSGGVDSMSLLHYLYTSGYKVSVAHINYHLRGDESSQDQRLVESYCEAKDIACYIYELSQDQVSSLQSGNLQEKARDIRFDFFNAVMLEQQLDYLCTAHHADDQVETMLINMTRGANLTGLTSMRAQVGQIRRPFLSLDKSEIVAYTNQHDIPYRLDQSNLKSDYDRNFIRNEVLKAMYNKILRSQKGIRGTHRYLEEERRLRDYYITKERAHHLEQKGELTIVNSLSSIAEHGTPGLLLYYLIKDFGFNKTQADLILQRHGSEERYFSSATHEAVVKKEQLLIRLISEKTAVDVSISGPGSYDIGSGTLSLSPTDTTPFTSDPNVELSNIDFAQGPLTVRSWSIGDRFAPYGMNGQTKKLSDFFGELKLNKFEKEQVKLLVQGDQIIWVIGHRLSHYFRVTDGITPVLLSYDYDRM